MISYGLWPQQNEISYIKRFTNCQPLRADVTIAGDNVIASSLINQGNYPFI